MWCEALRGVPGGMSQIKSRGLVLTEPPLNSNINRETMVEVALEKLQCKAVSLQVQGILNKIQLQFLSVLRFSKVFTVKKPT